MVRQHGTEGVRRPGFRQRTETISIATMAATSQLRQKRPILVRIRRFSIGRVSVCLAERFVMPPVESAQETRGVTALRRR